MENWSPQLVSTIVFIAVLWTLPWKGVALWKAARNNDMVWFIVFMFVNTVGILEILYIFAFFKKKIQNIV